MEELIVNINPNILYLAGGVLVLIILISIVMKAFKIAIAVSFIVAIFLFFAPKVTDIQEQYDVKIDGGIAIVTINGETHEINTAELKNAQVEERDGDTYIVYMDNDLEKAIKIPGYMVGIVTSKLKDMTNQ